MGNWFFSHYKTMSVVAILLMSHTSLGQILKPSDISTQEDLSYEDQQSAGPREEQYQEQDDIVVELREATHSLERIIFGRDPGAPYDRPQSLAGRNAEKYENIKSQIEEEIAFACRGAEKEAVNCCSPEGALSCALGLDKKNEGKASAVSLILASAQLFATASSSAIGVAGACKAMKATGYASAGINALAANSCGKKRSYCENTCKASAERIIAEAESHCRANLRVPTQLVGYQFEVAADGSRIKHEYYGDLASYEDSPSCKAYREYKGLFEERQLVCNSLKRQEEQLRVQAMSSGISVALSAACEQQTAAVDPLSLDPAGDDICQDASNQTNPYCIVRNPQLCQLPANASNSACAGYGNNPNNPVNPGLGGPTIGPGSNTDGGINTADSIDGFQQNYDGNGNSAAPDNGSLGLASVQGGGGSGAPGGAGGGGGAGASGGGGYRGLSGASRGYNTDILKGARGGSGYSVTPSQFKSGGGGFAGYGRGGSAKGAGDDKKVNLKSYLPGAKNSPNRKFASIGNGEIGGKHGDIFKRVESKFNELCLFNRLVCDKSTRRVQKKK